jgi:histidyl-tRNA synthetase
MIELELIALSRMFWQKLGFADFVQLQVNTLGEVAERQRYKNSLIDYLKTHENQLDEDSKRRLERNPLRILDSKNPEMQQLIADAPKLIEVLDEKSRTHFETFCAGLDALNIPYTVNPVLVRGLDYYGHTVFEWVTDKLGSQATICAGGRYDLLVEQLGGTSTPAAGFALGIERICLLMETLDCLHIKSKKNSVVFITAHDEALVRALFLAESIRTAHPTIEVLVNTQGGSFKNQFKKADKSEAQLALILGEEEMAKNQLGIKDLRQVTEQITVDQNKINHYIQDYFNL